MGRLIRTVVGLVVGGFVLTMIAGAIAAVAAKRRIVPVDDPEADEIHLASIFAPLAFQSTAEAFRGGTLDCWYGGGTLDLRGATLAPEGALLTVKAIFGGGQIVVPASWRITNEVMGIGALNDARPAAEFSSDAPELTIEGLALFGGFVVMSELSEAQATWFSQIQAKAQAVQAVATEGIARVQEATKQATDEVAEAAREAAEIDQGRGPGGDGDGYGDRDRRGRGDRQRHR